MKFFLSVRIFNFKIPQLSLTFLFSFLVLSAACAPKHTVCTNFKDVTQYRTYCKRYSSNGRFCKAHGRQSYTIKVCTNYVCEQGYERVGGPCVKSGLEADLAREKLRALKKEQAPKKERALKKEGKFQGPLAPKTKRVYGPILSVAFSPAGRPSPARLTRPSGCGRRAAGGCCAPYPGIGDLCIAWRFLRTAGWPSPDLGTSPSRWGRRARGGWCGPEPGLRMG